MNPTKLRDWMEVVGIFAVVASLIFVGLQMKQAQDIAIAEQYQVRGIFGAEHVGSYVENERLFELEVTQFQSAYQSGELGEEITEDIKDDYKAFGPSYVTANFINASKALVTMDAYYFQYQQGFMEQEAWNAFRYRLKKLFGSDYLRSVYLDDPEEWRESFRVLCDEILDEIAAEAT